MFRLSILVFFLVHATIGFSMTENSKWRANVISEKETYSLAMICEHALSINEFQTCSLQVESLNRPVENLSILIDGGMPTHNHGLPTSPEIIWSAENKNYQIRGLKFSMPGDWVLNFYVNKYNDKPRDKAQFRFTLQ